MRKLTVFLALVLAMALAAPLSAGEPPPKGEKGPSKKKDPAGFEKLKALSGEWETRLPDGSTARVVYAVTAGGSAVVETLFPGTEHSMTTVYHADGDSILMTHYCAANNQPRMRARAAGPDPGELSFKFVDAANLRQPSEGHMSALTLTFEDADHIAAAWTWTGEGGSKPEVFKFARSK